MKTILILCMALLIISCNNDDEASNQIVVEAECLTNSLGNGIIAFYPFNGGSLVDESGNNNDLINTTNANASADRNGNANCAYVFDNSASPTEYLTTNDASFLDGLNEFSVSLWFQIQEEEASSFSTLQGLFGRGMERHCPDKYGEWSIGIFDCSVPVFGFENSVRAARVTDSSDGCQAELDAKINNWQHVVGVYNRGNMKIYIDGVLNGERNASVGCTDNDVESLDLFIGFNFTGAIDDIVIYNRELSPSEVSDLFLADTCCE